MNFFEHQAHARSQTRRLVFLFALAVLATTLVIDACILLALHALSEEPVALVELAVQHRAVLAGVGVLVLAIILIASLYKSMELRAGGGMVARLMGGTLVPPDTRSPQLRRLRNIVEEIAIASGVPVPEIYVMEQEAGLNAFAAGYVPADAAVAVTQGCLDKLSRDELQGVIAHEFSHILNGDMRLNIRLMGILFGILVLAIIGRKIMRISAEADDIRPLVAGVTAGFVLMLIGYIGYFFGQMIKAGVSRQREFLADASAVQFTRQSLGIAGALRKIGGVRVGSRLHAARTEEASHMLFGDGVGYSQFFATHPPLFERIRRIDPSFHEGQLRQQAKIWNEPGYVAEEGDHAIVAGFAAQATLEPAAVIEQIGHPSCDAYLHAEALHAAIPEVLLAAAADEVSAWPLIFALLLDADAAMREKQLQFIEKRFGPARSSATASLRHALEALPAAQRLPLVALTFPRLRRRPREELMQLLATVSQLIRADGHIGMFEFCMGYQLRMQVTDALNPARAEVIGSAKLADCRDQVVALLTALAQCGHDDAVRARQAFLAGINHLYPREVLRYTPLSNAVAPLEDALSKLNQLNAHSKQYLIEALVTTLNHDHRMTVGEAELLRVVCAALHCPLPSLLQATA